MIHFGIPEILLLLLIAIYCFALPKILSRAGQTTWMTYVPILQFLPFLKTIQRPWYWILLLMVPGVNLIMLVIINVELGIVFNLRSTKEQWLFGALPWVRIIQLAFQPGESTYVGARDWSKTKKSFARDWSEAILFAVVAATVIRSFFLEAFTIPTPSMEKSMLVGDYLFVSKFSYGTKLPQTPMSIPFLHNALPGSSMINSYVDWFSLPYFRLPGIGHVERFDPVVFNFPHGDTILVDPYYAGHDYYGILMQEAIVMASLETKTNKDTISGLDKYKQNPEKYRQMARDNFNEKKVCVSCGYSKGNGRPFPIGGTRFRPMDKKENYIKRCIGLPGETLQIEHRQVMINGTAVENPEGLMFNYQFELVNPAMKKRLEEKYTINNGDLRNIPDSSGQMSNWFECPLTFADYQDLKNSGDVKWIKPQDKLEPDMPGVLFPNSMDEEFATWTEDNFGPLVIPAKGMTIAMNHHHFELYKRVIQVYEGHTIQEVNGAYLIDGQPTNQYTFESDYYWMMGDNRHHSTDSRFWGFVPENHVVGKAVFTWFSKGNPEYHRNTKIRWNRMFRLVD